MPKINPRELFEAQEEFRDLLGRREITSLIPEAKYLEKSEFFQLEEFCKKMNEILISKNIKRASG